MELSADCGGGIDSENNVECGCCTFCMIDRDMLVYFVGAEIS